jgi:hypothetical protein
VKNRPVLIPKDEFDVLAKSHSFSVWKKPIIVEKADAGLVVAGKNERYFRQAVHAKIRDMAEMIDVFRIGDQLVHKDGSAFLEHELERLVRFAVARVPLAIKSNSGFTNIEVNAQVRASLIQLVSQPSLLNVLTRDHPLPCLRYANDPPSSGTCYVLSPADFPSTNDSGKGKAIVDKLFRFLERSHSEVLLSFLLVALGFVFGRLNPRVTLAIHVWFGPNRGGKGSLIRVLSSPPRLRPPHHFSADHAGKEYTSDEVAKAEGSLAVCQEINFVRAPDVPLTQRLKSMVRREIVTVRGVGRRASKVKAQHGVVFHTNPLGANDPDAARHEVCSALAQWVADDRFDIACVNWRGCEEGERIGTALDELMLTEEGRLEVAHAIWVRIECLRDADLKPNGLPEKYREARTASALPPLEAFLEDLLVRLGQAAERIGRLTETDVPKREDVHVIISLVLRPLLKEHTDATAFTPEYSGGTIVSFWVARPLFNLVLCQRAIESRKWLVPRRFVELIEKTSDRKVRFHIERDTDESTE